MDIRKTLIIKETIEADGVGEACDPITRVVAVAVVQNPFAGRFVEDLSPLFDIGGQLGERLMGDAAGVAIDLPLGHKDEAWSFDHIDTMTVMVADAPRPDEIMLCMAVSDGPRPHPRVGKGPITD